MEIKAVCCAQCRKLIVVDKKYPSVEMHEGRLITAYVCSIDCLIKRVIYVYQTTVEKAQDLENGK